MFNLGEIAMKKSLIALAVLAVSGAAYAQSSVTLYGVADAGVGAINKKWNDADSDAPKGIQFTSGSMVNNGNSRIGLRGVEDLGSGLKVGFNFDQGIDLDDGTLLNGSTWGREANVWVGGDSWGRVKLGRSLTPSYYGLAAYELTGAANYSVVGNTYGFVGAGSRNNSQFSYASPNWGGFGFEVGYVSKNDRADDGNKWDANITYKNGGLGVGLSGNKVSGTKANYAAGAKYDFGSFAVAGSFQENRNYRFAGGAAPGTAFAGGFPISGDYTRRGVTLGGTARFGAASLTVDLTRDLKHKLAGVDQKKYTNGLVEGKYALSKRTFVYGAYLRLEGTNNWGLGMRHNF